MSLRFWLGVVAGAAGGYSVGRVMEARAHGVPLDLAFKNLGTSMMVLKQQVEAGAAQLQRMRDDVTNGNVAWGTRSPK